MQTVNSAYTEGELDGLIKLRNIDDFQTYKRSVDHPRLLVEHLLAKDNQSNKTWNLIGFCEPCGKESRFMVDWLYSDGIIPNYRERLICEHCGLNNRQRFIAGFLKRLLRSNGKPIAQVYASEQEMNFYKYIKDNVNVVERQYQGSSDTPGQSVNKIPYEDTTKLSFNNNSLDIIVSNDEYEHVPDIQKKLKDAYRVLKNNGKLLISIPFKQTEKRTKQRAFIDNGKIVHLLPAQYHGDPLNEKGSLIFYDYGWDFLNFCKAAGFRDAYILAYYSLFFGYIGEGLQAIIIADKI